MSTTSGWTPEISTRWTGKSELAKHAHYYFKAVKTLLWLWRLIAVRWHTKWVTRQTLRNYSLAVRIATSHVTHVAIWNWPRGDPWETYQVFSESYLLWNLFAQRMLLPTSKLLLMVIKKVHGISMKQWKKIFCNLRLAEINSSEEAERNTCLARYVQWLQQVLLWKRSLLTQIW